MENTTQTNTSHTEPEQTVTPPQGPSGKEKFRSFLASNVGYYVMVAVFAVILWGITLLLASSESTFGGIIALICAVFGWKALNSILPSMTLVLSLPAWGIFYLIKFILSVIIGIFVAPFVLGKWVAGLINDSLQ